MKGFINFIREQGVVGLAVGFILGGAISKVVSGLVNDIINPLIGSLLGGANLDQLAWQLGENKIMFGAFVNTVIDFIIVALVVYFGVRILKLDRLDKKKE
ncbi:MAG: large conductance mechanosensitive channel protein MscL [Patescibacteria group bacterium]|jgi:large conductance mechanosensitive channel